MGRTLTVFPRSPQCNGQVIIQIALGKVWPIAAYMQTQKLSLQIGLHVRHLGRVSEKSLTPQPTLAITCFQLDNLSELSHMALHIIAL